MNLADNRVGSPDKEIDILIGGQTIIRVLLWEILVESTDLVALDTILGWILSGSFPTLKT